MGNRRETKFSMLIILTVYLLQYKCFAHAALSPLSPKATPFIPRVTIIPRGVNDKLSQIVEEINTDCSEKQEDIEKYKVLFENSIKKMWKDAEIEVYGSAKYGMYIPRVSDLDFAVSSFAETLIESTEEKLGILAKQLQKDLGPESCEIILTEHSIIKLVLSDGMHIDVSLLKDDSHIKVAQIIRNTLSLDADVKSLLLLIKVYLHKKRLNIPYEGTMGSYVLILMMRFFFLNTEKVLSLTLGEKLVEFLRNFGTRSLFIGTDKIMRFPRADYALLDSKSPLDPHFHHMFIQDPAQEVLTNAGASAFNIQEVQKAFDELCEKILMKEDKPNLRTYFLSHTNTNNDNQQLIASLKLDDTNPGINPVSKTNISIVVSPKSDENDSTLKEFANPKKSDSTDIATEGKEGQDVHQQIAASLKLDDTNPDAIPVSKTDILIVASPKPNENDLTLKDLAYSKESDSTNIGSKAKEEHADCREASATKAKAENIPTADTKSTKNRRRKRRVRGGQVVIPSTSNTQEVVALPTTKPVTKPPRASPRASPKLLNPYRKTLIRSFFGLFFSVFFFLGPTDLHENLTNADVMLSNGVDDVSQDPKILRVEPHWSYPLEESSMKNISPTKLRIVSSVQNPYFPFVKNLQRLYKTLWEINTRGVEDASNRLICTHLKKEFHSRQNINRLYIDFMKKESIDQMPTPTEENYRIKNLRELARSDLFVDVCKINKNYGGMAGSRENLERGAMLIDERMVRWGDAEFYLKYQNVNEQSQINSDPFFLRTIQMLREICDPKLLSEFSRVLSNTEYDFHDINVDLEKFIYHNKMTFFYETIRVSKEEWQSYNKGLRYLDKNVVKHYRSYMTEKRSLMKELRDSFDERFPGVLRKLSIKKTRKILRQFHDNVDKYLIKIQHQHNDEESQALSNYMTKFFLKYPGIKVVGISPYIMVKVHKFIVSALHQKKIILAHKNGLLHSRSSRENQKHIEEKIREYMTEFENMFPKYHPILRQMSGAAPTYPITYLDEKH